jgi:transposase
VALQPLADRLILHLLQGRRVLHTDETPVAQLDPGSEHLIDNNPVGNTIRPIAPGKKNWLFTGSERAERRAAAIQTLLGTVKLNGINPAQWLAGTLEKLPAWPDSRIDELLPLAPEAIEALLKECA